jgi:hypothetical protein
MRYDGNGSVGNRRVEAMQLMDLRLTGRILQVSQLYDIERGQR